jgi:hypothetical protein
MTGRRATFGRSGLYRRDRRKDQLLQENGYLMPRFLAEDLAKEFDTVLDGILRALTTRRTPSATTHALKIVRAHFDHNP